MAKRMVCLALAQVSTFTESINPMLDSVQSLRSPYYLAISPHTQSLHLIFLASPCVAARWIATPKFLFWKPPALDGY